MAFTCAVKMCNNSKRKIMKWQQEVCEAHDCIRSDKLCTCLAPFRLYPFPTEKKQADRRSEWIRLVNRVGSDGKLWNPSKDARVCSKHFVTGMPTDLNPNPTLNMGYDSSARATMFSPVYGKRKRHVSKNLFQTSAASTSTSTTKKRKKNNLDKNKLPPSIESNSSQSFDKQKSTNIQESNIIIPADQDLMQPKTLDVEDMYFDYVEVKKMKVSDIYKFIISKPYIIFTKSD